MRKWKIFFVAAGVIANLNGFAQVTEPGNATPPDTGITSETSPGIRVSEAKPDTCTISEPHNLAAVRSGKLIRNVAYPGLAAGALTASYFFLDHDLRNDFPNDVSKFKNFVAEWAEPLGRSATIVPGFGALMAYGLVAKNPKARKAAAIGIATFYLNDGVTTQLKKGFGRMRPSSGADHDEWFAGEPHRSFPSSHTSTAFAAATVLASVYKDKKLVAPVAYSLATVVGLSRLYHNQHWASDVVGGAIVGYLTAKATYFTYNYFERKWKTRKQLMLLPNVSPNGFSATAVLSF